MQTKRYELQLRWLFVRLPVLELFGLYWNNRLGFNPTQPMGLWLGRLALAAAFLSLACFTLTYFDKKRSWRSWGTSLSRAAIFYALLHVFVYINWVQRWDLLQVWQNIKLQWFTRLGLISLIGLLLLGIKPLGLKKWLTFLGFVTVASAIIHFGLARKGNLWQLQGDVAIPLGLLGLLLILLIFNLIAYFERKKYRRG